MHIYAGIMQKVSTMQIEKKNKPHKMAVHLGNKKNEVLDLLCTVKIHPVLTSRLIILELRLWCQKTVCCIQTSRKPFKYLQYSSKPLQISLSLTLKTKIRKDGRLAERLQMSFNLWSQLLPFASPFSRGRLCPSHISRCVLPPSPSAFWGPIISP